MKSEKKELTAEELEAKKNKKAAIKEGFKKVFKKATSGKVFRYNLFRGVSTVLTVGTPGVVLGILMDEAQSSPPKMVSAATIYAILLLYVALRDKLAETFKAPSALKISFCVFIICLVIKNIAEQLIWTSACTIVACGVDEFTFKRLFTNEELILPEVAKTKKKFGFIISTSKSIYDLDKYIKAQKGVENEQIR